MFDEKYYEKTFFEVLGDLKDYLPYLTLVGGWLPYVYMKFLWKLKRIVTVHTTDIDFGFSGNESAAKMKTVFERLSSSNYKERHMDMGRLYPVVLLKDGRIRLDFIMANRGKSLAEDFFGREIYINKVENFDFLLRNRMKVIAKYRSKLYEIFCPSPEAFVLHKCFMFPQRSEKEKSAKDLYYAYLILRYAPAGNLAYIKRYGKEIKLKAFKNIKEHFVRKTSGVCLMIEKEYGSEFYLPDLRADILRRFNEYAKTLL